MKILRKYILVEFFKLLIPVSLFLILIFALSEFFWRLPDFISHKTPYYYIIYYLSLHVPLWFVQTLPIAVMLTTLLLITHLQYTRELISIKTLGINTRSFFSILLILGIIFSAISFYVYDNLATKLFNKAQLFFNIKIKEIPQFSSLLKNLFYYDNKNNAFIYIGEYDPHNKKIKNWFVEKFNDGFLELNIISPYGIKKDNIVELKDCIIYKYKKNKFLSQTKISTYEYALPIDIENFQYDYHTMQLDQKNIQEIKKIIEFMKYKGDTPARFLTEIYFRYAITFLNFIVILFAIPLAQIKATKYGSLVSFIYTITTLIVYWIVLSIFRVVCEIGILSHFYIWVPNFLFIIIGTLLYLKVK
ncbi:MAG: LptF/LptG family permease [Elusimicrobiota bacterium]|nr:LptF/LptG family permease [Endomicrobiia bacterium]MDW8165385.1 LptF/LptG family permease [Elusimicrobiota bacterium]